MNRFVAAIALVLGAALSTAHADLGEPDRSFGAGGTTVLPAPVPTQCQTDCSRQPAPHTLLRQSDGKLVAGTFRKWAYNHRFGYQLHAVGVYRALSDGTLDTSFADGGFFALEEHSYQFPPALKLKLTPDGRVVGAASFTIYSPPSPSVLRIKLFRLDSNGAPDATFGGTGTFTHDGAEQMTVHDVALQPDGGMLVGFSTGSSAQVMRVTAAGVLDTTFGTAGFATLSASTRQVFLEVQSSGRILVVGLDSNYEATVSALAPAGTPDPAYPLTPVPNLTVSDAILDKLERLVLAGSYQGKAALSRVLAGGALDTAFGSGGLAVQPGAPAAHALAETADGKLVASAPQAGSVVRFLDNGHNDASLRGTGVATTIAGAAAGIVAIPDGGVVMASTGFVPYPNYTFGPGSVARVTLTKMGGFTLPLFTDAAAFAQQQYRDFLGREADADGTAFWAARIDAGMTRAQAVESFLGSPEFGAIVAPVARLYFAYFDRLPDYAGMTFYVRFLREGNTLGTISNVFATSPEFANTYGWLDNAAFVRLVYRNVMNREPDTDGFNYWKTRLDQQMPRGDMMLAFSESPEFRAITASEVSVTMAYLGMLRRIPEPAGFDFWVGRLDAGDSITGLIQAFLDSPEYKGRFVP